MNGISLIRPPAHLAESPYAAQIWDCERDLPATAEQAVAITGAIWPNSAMPEPIDFEAGVWNVDVPRPFGGDVWKFAIDVITADGLRLTIESDSA